MALTLGVLGVCGAAHAAGCPGNPGALGTSRVMTIDPADYPRIGTMQYSETLPLNDKEVVLTFDDGPMPPYTNRILEVLAADCVKANYFIIGRMARGYPDMVRRIQAEGHVIGTHSENHPLAFNKMPIADVRKEIETGIASTAEALRDPNGVAPFFRIPGLLRAEGVEGYLRTRRMTVWSADVAGDDWKHLTAADVVRRIMSRLAEKGKGIVLLHDIQPATALALPELLRQLRKGGYKIVQVAPVRAPLVASAPAPTAPTASEPPRAAPRPPPFARLPTPEPAKPAPTKPEPTKPAATEAARQAPSAAPLAAVNPPEAAPPRAVPVPAPEPSRPDPQVAAAVVPMPPPPEPAPAPAIVTAQTAQPPAQIPPPETPAPSSNASNAAPSVSQDPDARPLTAALKPSQSDEIASAKMLVLPSAPSPRASLIHRRPAADPMAMPGTLALSVPPLLRIVPDGRASR